MAALAAEGVERQRDAAQAAEDEAGAAGSGAGEEVELGFFESDAGSDDDDDGDDDQDGREPRLHEDGNWLRWANGVAGGPAPVWLRPFRTPEEVAAQVACPTCKEPRSFLLQIYAPLDGADFAQAFHRALYVFLCRKPDCKSEPTVLRTQLPRDNPFYAASCANEDEDVPTTFDRSTLPELRFGPSFPPKVIVTEPEPDVHASRCAVCDVVATARCVACRVVTYCSKEHQREHWPKHKQICKLLQAEMQKEGDGAIDDDQPVEGAQPGKDGAEESEAPLGPGEKSDADFSQEDLDDLITGGSAALKAKIKKDPAFERFQDRIAREPAQCLRYCRWPSAANSTGQGGEDSEELDEIDNDDLAQTERGPLWLATEGQLAPSAVPPCDKCGSPREFEMQILPQTLHYLNELDADFGTICVYTCTKSCALEDGELAAEFVYTQHL